MLHLVKFKAIAVKLPRIYIILYAVDVGKLKLHSILQFV